MASSTATRRSGGSRECPAKDERGDRSATRRRFTNTAEEQDPHFPQRFPGGKEGPSDFSSHCLKSSASSQRHGEMGPLRNRTNASTQGVPPQLNGPPDERGIRFIEMEFLKRDLQTIQRSPSLAPERCGLWDVSNVPIKRPICNQIDIYHQPPPSTFMSVYPPAVRRITAAAANLYTRVYYSTAT